MGAAAVGEVYNLGLWETAIHALMAQERRGDSWGMVFFRSQGATAGFSFKKA